MVKNIVIIGVGVLGKRHLQSLAELDDNYQIYAVEKNGAVCEALKKEFTDVIILTSIDGLPNIIDTIIIATNSDVRRSVFEQLVNHSRIKNIIFEKVLFQKMDDYYIVQKQLWEKGINAWVNCARREWDSYKVLRNELLGCVVLRINASGGNWGLGCNAIHVLDLIEFLTGEKIERIDTSNLEDRVIESKRKGFYEFFGTITGRTDKGCFFEISCMDSVVPMCIEIMTDNTRLYIDEIHNRMFIANALSDWKWKEKEFKQEYQSQMTCRVVNTIIEEGGCNLTKYDDSMELHIKFLTSIMDFFSRNGMGGSVCPIT